MKNITSAVLMIPSRDATPLLAGRNTLCSMEPDVQRAGSAVENAAK